MLLLAAWPPAPVRAAEPPSRAELLADVTAVQPGKDFALGVRISLDPGWHTYWANPGDSGMAPELAWTLPEGAALAGALLYPAPTRFADGDLITFGYAHEVLLIQPIRVSEQVPAGARLTIRLQLRWLICKDLCRTASADLERTVSVQSDAPTAAPPEAARFASARQASSSPLPGWRWRASAGRKTITLCVAQPEGAPTPDMKSATFFPLQRDVVAYAPAPWRRTGGQYCLELRRFDAGAKLPERLLGVLVLSPDAPDARRAITVDVPLKAEP